VAESLEEVGFRTPLAILSTYVGEGQGLQPWLEDADINSDRDLRLQYLAGMGVNVDAQYAIHSQLIRARRLPDGLFVGSEANLAELRNAIESGEPDVNLQNPARQ